MSEKPFECGPEEGRPSTTSPACVSAAVDDAVFLHDAHAEAREVVILAVVHAGHFRRLAADQRAARLHAALDDAGDHTLADRDIERTGREIIQKEQWLGALHHDVVHAHGHQIDAHGVVPAGVDGEAQLRADAIRAGDQHGLAVAVEGYFHEGAESADSAEDLATHRAPHVRLDALDQLFARVDIDAGRAVSDGCSISHSDPRVNSGLIRQPGQLWYFTSENLRTYAITSW